MNYGGMSWRHSLELVEHVPGLKLVFDTGNPPISNDYAKSEPIPQDPVEFYERIQPHIAYIHIKDARLDGDHEIFTYPGEGGAQIPEILRRLKRDGYHGGLSIEPHMAAVFHDPNAAKASEEESYAIYLEYGRRTMGLLTALDMETTRYSN